MKRILVVDDNTEYLQVLSSVLSGDFDTIKATGVKEALDILQAVTVDAICSDFNMKDGTGLDLLEKIRHKGLRTPFLLMSGDDSRTLEQKAKLYYGGFCCKTDFDLIRKVLIGLTQQGTRFRCLSQLILAVPAIESGVKLIHTNHIL